MSTQPSLLMQQTATAAQPGTFETVLFQIAPWLLIFVIFYVLMIRPQQRRVKEHQAAINAVKKGDEVVTGGGIRGKVTRVEDHEVEVEIASGVRIRVVKATLTDVVSRSKPAND